MLRLMTSRSLPMSERGSPLPYPCLRSASKSLFVSSSGTYCSEDRLATGQSGRICLAKAQSWELLWNLVQCMLWLTGEESRRATEIEGKLFARRMSVRRAKQTRHGFRERNVTDHIMTDLHLFWVGTCGHSPSPWFSLSLQCCRILVKRSSPGTVGRSL